MATSVRKWIILDMYIWIYMLIILDCWVWDVKGFEYTSSTQSTLCTAQCEALCLSGEVIIIISFDCQLDIEQFYFRNYSLNNYYPYSDSKMILKHIYTDFKSVIKFQLLVV